MAVEVVRERPEHRTALGRELIEIDVRAAHGDAQAGARAADHLGHGVGTDSEVGSDLGVGASLDVAQRERAALPARQDCGAALDEALLLDEQDRALGVDLEIVIRAHRPLDVPVRDLVVVAELLPEEVARRGVQVAGDVHVRRRFGEPGDEANEDLLHQVLGRVGIAGQAPAAPPQFRGVRLVQLLVRPVGGGRRVETSFSFDGSHSESPR